MAMPANSSSSQSDVAEALQHYTPDMLAFCHKLPKVELHAHLNGSVRTQTIREIIEERRLTGITPADMQLLEMTGHRALADCFKVFDIIHRVTTTHQVITQITREVLADFAADNVVYLELRTTPKARPEHSMTKQSYLEAVLQGVTDFHQHHADSPILVKLLLSIDRREGPEAAMDTVELACRYQAQGVVGLDLSGSPYIGSWASWEAALAAGRAAGLRVTLHAGEVYSPDETREMLHRGPERLGHCCCLDQDLEAQLLASAIPVELCLTSNLLSSSVPSYPEHHFRALHAAGHPVVLCTDDSGLFGTTLSREYAVAAHAFGLTECMLKDLVTSSVEYAFASAHEKEGLRVQVAAALESMRRASSSS